MTDQMMLRRFKGAVVWKEHGKSALAPWTTWMLLATNDTFTASPPGKLRKPIGCDDNPLID